MGGGGVGIDAGSRQSEAGSRLAGELAQAAALFRHRPTTVNSVRPRHPLALTLVPREKRVPTSISLQAAEEAAEAGLGGSKGGVRCQAGRHSRLLQQTGLHAAAFAAAPASDALNRPQPPFPKSGSSPACSASRSRPTCCPGLGTACAAGASAPPAGAARLRRIMVDSGWGCIRRASLGCGSNGGSSSTPSPQTSNLPAAGAHPVPRRMAPLGRCSLLLSPGRRPAGQRPAGTRPPPSAPPCIEGEGRIGQADGMQACAVSSEAADSASAARRQSSTAGASG